MSFETVKSNLESKGYTVVCFDSAAQASDYLDSKIDNKTVGFGGSATLEQMGLFERLSSHNRVFWHARSSQGSDDDVRMQARETEVYLSSVNGLAQTGEIVNIDGKGNRVSETLFGHKKVYLIVGKNKVADNYDSALWRARNVAAPLNARRLGRKTPCAVNADKCYDCNSPQRICKALVVFWEKPIANDVEVILINENLGF